MEAALGKRFRKQPQELPMSKRGWALYVLFISAVPFLSPVSKVKVTIPEPSDIATTSIGSHWIVSDRGALFLQDSSGKVTQFPIEGNDFEGVCLHNNKLYCVEESIRKVLVYNPNTKVTEQSFEVPYAGGRNSGYESIAFDEQRQEWLLITEKNPVIIKRFNTFFQPISEQIIQIASDISSAVFYKNRLFLLSDQESKVMEVDPISYQLKSTFRIKALNPEGLSFSEDFTRMYILSDEEGKLYTFSNPFKP